MSVLVFIIVIVVLTGVVHPLAQGLARRIAKGAPDSADVKRMQALLEQTDQRLQDAERRLHDAEERLDFQEKLLSSRATSRDAG